MYHHFPDGKAEMVKATLDYSQQWFEENILQVLQQKETALGRLQETCDRINALYESGEQPCLLAALITGAPRDTFQGQVKARLQAFIGAIATLLTQSGLDADLARQRGEDAAIAIQGVLILTRGLEDVEPFVRAIAQLPEKLCEGSDAESMEAHSEK